MEEFLTLVALVLAVAVVLAPIMALIALRRTGRLRDFERRLKAAEKALDRLYRDRAPVAEEPASPATRAPEVFRKEQPAAATPPPTPPVEPQRPIPAPPTPAEPPAPAPAPRPAAATTRPVTSPPRPVKKPLPPLERPPRIEWERWIGVRGAAAVGGLVLALAGLLFFKHAFDQGWITPRTRVLTGGAVGLAAIAAAEWLRHRSYRFTPAAAAAGGIVILYASTWASYRLYEFLSALAALPLMAIITAGCAALSIRHRSQLVAILGLVGGFATPLLLSIQHDHPIGLFGYLLLLDLGLLAVGQRMRWPSLALLGVLGTFVVELVWTARDLDGEFFPLALVSLGVFALVFAAMGQRSGEEQRRRWFISQAGALLLPFAFATYFASQVDFGAELWPLAILIAALGAGAIWIGRAQGAAWLGTGAAAGALAIVATWLARHGWRTEQLWDLNLSILGLAAVFQGLDLWFRRGAEPPAVLTFKRWSWSAPIAPALVAVGLAAMLPIAAGMASDRPSWSWLVGALGLAVLLHFQGVHSGSGILRGIGGAAAGFTLAIHLPESSTWESFPGIGVTFLWITAAAGLLMGLAWRGRRVEAQRESNWSWHAAGAFLVPLLVALPQGEPFREAFPPVILGGTLGLALLISLSSVAIGRGRWYLVSVLLLFFVHTEWLGHIFRDDEAASIAGELVLFELGVTAVLIAWVFLFQKRLSETGTAWRAAAVVPLLAFPLIERLFHAHFDTEHPFWTPLALGLLAAAGLGAIAPFGPRLEAVRHAAQRWFGAVCVFLGSLLFARVFDHEVLVVTTSLLGLGLALLWRWRDHPVIKFACLTSLVVATFGVVVGCGRDQYYPNAELLLWNWTSYGTILPAAGALGAAVLLRPLEVVRARKWERGAYSGERPWIATATGLVGAVALFLWINLQIYLHFETRDFLHIDFDHFPARDLTMSIVWILYALAILAVGMIRRSSGLRWLSLAFLILSLGKVFLHDLGDLAGLYRVGSLAGLALSLLFVSVLYQRFVFPREREEETAEEAIDGDGGE